ncbi:hypothetical protein PFICI_01532 [Pestalotiopsis fici W106-1]|uniref:C2H2 type master regulator of conidiophore development brlA n=1 Tax=Pestalotiopsis fici (strain W106-1 / CGMCC3.15140) TaxID=1229662 RepID=W3XP07_PESFW|nr:uncharacterized protein PFICI_01532 [Pestalotiopsis fici W106-1]ETS87704.1 hypothetical protein PFICI_01532 [Pestalotiopsis fici W106-1]
MQARDAAGRSVSLLNDDTYSRPLTYRAASHYHTTGDASPLPHTPELFRSNSYDSNSSYPDPLSPMTPQVYDFSQSQYDNIYPADKSATLKRPSYIDAASRSNSFMDEESSNSSVPERTAKRYPCRYRDSHGCEKTFTTSGHASRHSKIHTAEKAVQCTYVGCHKKFTRADNMKQHLETHYKDKSRSSSKSSSKSSLSSSSKRGSVSARSTGSSVSSHGSQDVAMWDADHYSVTSECSWDMRGLTHPLMTRPGATRTQSSGLDALAVAAIACQEGGA